MENLQSCLPKTNCQDGVYIQHSANYHRLMLQTALWVQTVAASIGKVLPRPTLDRLTVATRWLLDLLDPVSGRVLTWATTMAPISCR